MASEFSCICLSNSLCILRSISFSSVYVTAHTVVNSVPAAHLARSARHNSFDRFFFAGLWPLHSCL